MHSISCAGNAHGQAGDIWWGVLFPLKESDDIARCADLASYLLSLKGMATVPTEGTLETDETEYARLPYVGVALSCLNCGEAEERKE